MLELEGLAAHRTLELPLLRPVHVVGHVALQLGQVGELLRARLAGLKLGMTGSSATVVTEAYVVRFIFRYCDAAMSNLTTFSETSDSHTKLQVEQTTAQIHLETVIAL